MRNLTKEYSNAPSSTGEATLCLVGQPKAAPFPMKKELGDDESFIHRPQTAAGSVIEFLALKL